MDLFLALCTAIGLGLAAGIGGPLAWLFVSVMASFQAGIDLRGTDWEFIGKGWFVAVMFATNVAAYVERSRDMLLRIPMLGASAVLGGVFGAGALVAEGEPQLLGFVIGALAGAGSATVAFDVLAGARRRAEAASEDSSTASTLALFFGLAGVVTALLALYLPPASLLAALALGVLASGRRRKAGEKYEGLRILR